MGCGSSTRIEPVQKAYDKQLRVEKPSFTSKLPPKDDCLSLSLCREEPHVTPPVSPPKHKKNGVIPDPVMFADIDKHALELRVEKPSFTSKLPPKDDCLSFSSCREEPHVTPPVSPPKHKKNDVIPDPVMFVDIDKHALEAPNRVRGSIEDLAKYLVKPARNNLEKIRAFYRWITHNISYDVESFFSGKHSPSDPQSVLQSGKAVCQGYGEMFDQLCKLAHIPCHVVSGFSKGFGYNPEIPFTVTTKTSHAWNIVLVKGEWRPVECTWGAGHLNTNNTFVKEYSEFYFLTDPEEFVHAHFPFMGGDEIASQAFQLLKHPVRLNEFNRSVKPSSHSLEWGIKLLSHKEHTITVKDEVDILLQGREPLLKNVICHLIEKTSNKDYSNFTMIKPDGNGKFSVRLRPPNPGKYQLEIFGNVDEHEQIHQFIVNYVIVCSSVRPSRQPYPEHKGAWGALAKADEYGFHPKIFSHSTFTSNNGEFELSLGITRQISAKCTLQFSDENNLDRYILLSCQPDSINIKAKFVQVGFHVIELFAGNPGSTSLECVAAFLVDNKIPAQNYLPFPHCWGAAHDHHCIIVEPLSGDLVVNEKTLLRCIAPPMKRLMVDKQVFTEKNGNVFEITMKPKSKGDLTVYGSTEETGTLNALFTFQVV